VWVEINNLQKPATWSVCKRNYRLHTAWTFILARRQVCKRMDFVRRLTVPLSVVIPAYLVLIIFCSHW